MMNKCRVKHKIATTYHLKLVVLLRCLTRKSSKLEKIVKTNRRDCALKLNDALWAYHTTLKTQIGTSPYKLMFEKTCHLPIELQHKAYCVIRKLNMDLQKAGENKLLELNEMKDFCAQAYENAKLYKEHTARCHDKKITP